MNFRITSIQTRIVEHPLLARRVIRSGAGTHDVSRYLAVAVTDSQGACGYGEAATTSLWSGESAETAQFFVEQVFTPRLLGHNFDHPRQVALDTAVWDLWARSQGKSALELFADRQPIPSIPARASVGCYDVQETVRIATEFWEAGIATLKFKIGVPDFDDKARLGAVREALGAQPVFTVDANGAYPTWQAAVSALEELLPFDLALIEQPTPPSSISAAARPRVTKRGGTRKSTIRKRP